MRHPHSNDLVSVTALPMVCLKSCLLCIIKGSLCRLGCQSVTTDTICAVCRWQGSLLADVANLERDYLLWMSAQDFSDETLAIVRNALAGHFPTRTTLPTAAVGI